MNLRILKIAVWALLAASLVLPGMCLAESAKRVAPMPTKKTAKHKKKPRSVKRKAKKRVKADSRKAVQALKDGKKATPTKKVPFCTQGMLWFAERCWKKKELRVFAPGVSKDDLLFIGTSDRNVSRSKNRLYIIERNPSGERLVVIKPASQMEKRNTKIAKRGGHPVELTVISSTDWMYMETEAGLRKFVRQNREWTQTINKRLGTQSTYTESTILLGSAGTIYTSSLGGYAHVIPSSDGESACNEPSRQKRCDQWAISMRERLESQCLQNIARANKLEKLEAYEDIARTTVLNSTLVLALMMPHTMGALGAAMSTAGGAASTVSLKGLVSAALTVKASAAAKATGWSMKQKIENAKKDAATYCSNRPNQEKFIQTALKRENCIHIGLCVPGQLPETEGGPDAGGNCPAGTALQPVTEMTMGYCTPSTMNCSCPPPTQAPSPAGADDDEPNEEMVIEERQGCYTEMETTVMKCAAI